MAARLCSALLCSPRVCNSSVVRLRARGKRRFISGSRTDVSESAACRTAALTVHPEGADPVLRYISFVLCVFSGGERRSFCANHCGGLFFFPCVPSSPRGSSCPRGIERQLFLSEEGLFMNTSPAEPSQAISLAFDPFKCVLVLAFTLCRFRVSTGRLP